MTGRLLLSIFVLFLCVGCASDAGPTLHHLAFGSCIKQDKPAPIFEVINEEKPDIFVFVGDNIYGDTEDMELLKAKYDLMTGRPGYQTLNEKSQILATWDDHDYGENDAGLEYPKKAESQQIFLDVFQEPEDSRRRRTDGIYTSYMYGPPEKRVQVILLDNRYFRTPVARGERVEKGGSYAPTTDPEATMLGDAQWAWLERELEREARVRLILGGTQILREHNGYEAWANFPREQEKLVGLIRKTRAGGVIFLTGDTHWAELTRREWDGCYPLYDFTSSGLTEVWKYVSPNRYRVEDKVYLGANFGSVKFDWGEEDPAISFRAVDREGTVRFEHQLRLSEISFPDARR